MSAEADKKRIIAEHLFPAEPLPGLIHSDNPQGRYEAWYNTLMKFKRKYLPGKPYEHHRQEINTFMKEGKLRGADSRMAIQPLMKEAAKICREWVASGGGQDTNGLYLQFCELNKRWATIPVDRVKN